MTRSSRSLATTRTPGSLRYRLSLLNPPESRHNIFAFFVSHAHRAQDKHLIAQPGEYHVIFDNTHSMLRKKVVRYKIHLTEPGPRPAAATASPEKSKEKEAAEKEDDATEGDGSDAKKSRKDKRKKKHKEAEAAAAAPQATP